MAKKSKIQYALPYKCFFFFIFFFFSEYSDTEPESQDKGANGVNLPQLKDLELSENHSGTLK